MLNVSAGRGVALRDLLGDEAVGLVRGAEPAEALGHAEAEQSRRVQVRVVVEGKGSVPVVPVGSGREPLPGQPPDERYELLLAGRGLQVHATRYHPGRGRVKTRGCPTGER
jgi:hypothetical protein